jgi:hypothetical protein
VAYTKKSITWHHNGARLSLQGILDVWKTREASAHFDVDAYGALGQYVRVNEYAWAVGNTIGNQESISIEMCNATLSPDWTVAEVTWREAARVAGFLHAKVIGTRPDRSSCHVHHDWKATLCAGPYIDSILNTMIADAQTSYDYFSTAVVVPPPPPPPPPDPTPPPPPPPDPVYEVQLVPRPADPSAPTPWLAPSTPIWTPTTGLPIPEVVEEIRAGKWGGLLTLRGKLRAAGYDPDAVRLEVLRQLHKSGEIRMRKQTMHIG